MIRKKSILSFLLIFLIYLPVSAVTLDAGGSKIDNYEQAIKRITKAKKLEKKGKIKKSKKLYEKSIIYLLKAYSNNPTNPDILNDLGFLKRKIGNYEEAEIYYLLGLDLDPKHRELNGYLGELYIETNRIDKAKERLEVLENCNCEEYDKLKKIIEKTKKS